MKAEILLGIVGAVVGAAATVGIGVAMGGAGSDEAPAPSASASLGEAPAAGPCARLDERQDALDGLVVQKEVLQGLIAGHRQVRDEIAGQPVDWDPGLPAQDQPQSVEARLEQALAAGDIELFEIDCDEDPCVAVAAFHVPAGADLAVAGEAHRAPVRKALGELTFGQISSLQQLDDGGYHYFIAGPVQRRADRREGDERTPFRAESLLNLVLDEVKDGTREGPSTASGVDAGGAEAD